MNNNKTKSKIRRKVTQACENCREKRVKCSGAKPSCQNCINLNIKCVYNAITKKRGPKSGYIEEIVSSRVLKEIEKIVTEQLISREDILKLANNNPKLFNSSEILKQYLKEHQKDIVTVKKEDEDIKKENKNSLSNEEYALSENQKKILTENKLDVTTTENSFLNNYIKIKIDLDIINEYFTYAHFYFPLLIKDIFMERLQNETLYPGLLLALYGANYMYKPHPDLNESLKYRKLAYNYIINNMDHIDIQLVQALALISNCGCGTNTGWILLGITLRMVYILRLNNDDKKLEKRYNEERKIAFWSIICKDMIISVVTGRCYRYDLYNFINSENAERFLKSVTSKNGSINSILSILLANILQKVIQYVKKSKTNTYELNILEEEIDYWFKVFQPEFDYDTRLKTETGDAITKLHFDIIFSTLKIILYRHKPTSVISKSKIRPPERLFNFLFLYNLGHLSKNGLNYQENQENSSKPKDDINKFESHYRHNTHDNDYNSIHHNHNNISNNTSNASGLSLLDKINSKSDKSENQENQGCDIFLSVSYDILKNRKTTSTETTKSSPSKDNIIESDTQNSSINNELVSPQMTQEKIQPNSNIHDQTSFIKDNMIYIKEINTNQFQIDYSSQFKSIINNTNTSLENKPNNYLKFDVESKIYHPYTPLTTTIASSAIVSNEIPIKNRIKRSLSHEDIPYSTNTLVSPDLPLPKRYKSEDNVMPSSYYLGTTNNNIKDQDPAFHNPYNPNNPSRLTKIEVSVMLDPIKSNNKYQEKVYESLLDASSSSHSLPQSSVSSIYAEKKFNGPSSYVLKKNGKFDNINNDMYIHYINVHMRESIKGNGGEETNVSEKAIIKKEEEEEEEEKANNYSLYNINDLSSSNLSPSLFSKFLKPSPSPSPTPPPSSFPENSPIIEISPSPDAHNHYGNLLKKVIKPLDSQNQYEQLITEFINVRDDEEEEEKKEKGERQDNGKEKGKDETESTGSFTNHITSEDAMTALKECYKIALTTTEKVRVLRSILDPHDMTYNYVLCWCFYQIGIIFMIWYVNEGKKADYETAKFYEELLIKSEKFYVAVSPYLAKYREMLEEAELSVKNGTRKLVIKDFL